MCNRYARYYRIGKGRQYHVLFVDFDTHIQPMGQLGGVARPVQRASGPIKETPTSPPAADGSGFGFLGKSSKVSAFDFVQEEMKASKKQ